METITKQYNVYEFDELTNDAKEYAINHFRDLQSDDTFWSECIIDDAKTIGKLIGIDIDNIYFSGFSSQGDGACFEGYYTYNKHSVKLLKDYAPIDKELHKIVESLYRLQNVIFTNSLQMLSIMAIITMNFVLI